MKHSPLEEEHRALGAKLGPFAGWLMPIEYAGTLAEHRTVREAVGLFDLVHLGKVTVEGPGALATLQRTVTNDVSKVQPGSAQYNTLLNERGGIVDDLIVYRLGEERFFVVPNAANTEAVHAALAEEADDAEVAQHDDWCFLAVQGPKATDVVSRHFPQAAGLAFMQCVDAEFRGSPVILTRSGYTGERGFELFPRGEVIHELWAALLESGGGHGIAPIGLGARDTLRLEMGYPLHGQDISPEITPVQARLGWAVGWKKDAFWGHQALRAEKEAGPTRVLRGLLAVGRGIPRPGMTVLGADDAPVGEVTSGTFSPSLKKGVALALVGSGLAEGDEVSVDVRGRREPFEIVKPPFVSVHVRED